MPIGVTPFQPNVTLKQDFGHSPLGSLGGRTVQQVGAQPPRAQGGVIGFFKNLGARIAQAFQSEGTRAQAKYRGALEQTSTQVGELLGCLSKTKNHGVDGIGAKNILDGLQDTMRPMTQLGANPDDVFSARVQVNLRAMTDAQLLQLRAGLDTASNSPLVGDARFGVIRESLTTEIETRILDKVQAGLKEVLEGNILPELRKGGGDPKEVQFVVDTALDGGSQKTLSEFGNPPTPEEGRALTKAVLIRMINSGDLSLEDARLVFSNLPSDRQRKYLETEPHPPQVQIQPVLDPLIERCRTERATTSETGFMDGARRLMEIAGDDDPKGPVKDPAGFAREIIGTLEHHATLLQHSDAHQLLVDPRVTEQLGTLKTQLQTLLAPGNLEVQKLNDRELQKLSSLLAKLGVPQGAERIKAEIDRRKEEARRNYTDAMRESFGPALRGDITAFAGSLRTSRGALDVLARRLEVLDGKAMDPDRAANFRYEMMMAAIEGMETAQLQELLTQLHTEDGQSLMSVFVAAGNDLSGLYETLGGSVMGVGGDAEMMEICLDRMLKERGVEVAEPAPRKYKLEDVTPGVRKALGDVFGVKIDDRFHVQRTWKPDYPQPRSVEEIVRTPNPALRREFRAFAEKAFVTESLDFLERHEAFLANPTLDGARELALQFVGNDAPQQINIEQSDSERIQDALASPQSGDMTPDQLRELFGKAFVEVRNMVRDGPYKNFIRTNGGAI